MNVAYFLYTITMKKLALILLFAVLANVASAQLEKTITNLIAGTLSTVLSSTEKPTITKLTLSGTMDSLDFLCLQYEMVKLADLDLAAVRIIDSDPISNTAEKIPNYAFTTTEGDGKRTLKTIILPKTLTAIGDCAFDHCPSLKTIVVPNAVTTLGVCTFNRCDSLTAVTLGESVQFIGECCFYGCSTLRTVRVLSRTPALVNQNSFDMAPMVRMYVPVGTLETYKSDSFWKLFNLYENVLTLYTLAAIKETVTKVKLTARLDYIADSPVLAHGFCWNTTGTPTTADSLIDNGSTTTMGDYSNMVSTMEASTKYYIRAYARDSFTTIYGKQITYTTPTLPADAGQISGLTTVNQGQTDVNYTVPTIANATSYIWILPKGASGTSTTNTIKVSFSNTATSGVIIVKGHNSDGDGKASEQAITVQLLPEAAGVITGYTTVCQGETQVTYTVPAIARATSYFWTLPTGVTGTSTTNTIVADYSNAAISGNVSVAGRYAYGDGLASSLAVTVHKLPVISLQDFEMIAGSSETLNASIDFTDGGTLRYKWTPSTGLDNDTITHPMVTVTNNITYSLSVTTPYGCTSTKDVRISIKPMEKPAIGIVGVVNGKNRIAWNKTVSNGIDSYLIYKETSVTDVYDKIGTVPYDSLSVFVDEFSAPEVKSAKYKLSILDKVGLESDGSAPHKTMHLTINKGQKGAWNLIWEPYVGFTPSTYNIYRGTSAANLNFLDATSGSSTQFSDLEAPSSDVYYQLEVISPNLISPTKVPRFMSKSQSSITSSYNASRSNIAAGMLNDLKAVRSDIRIYPNPVKEVLHIDFSTGSLFEIMNLTGQVVYSGDLAVKCIVNMCNFKPGMYVVKIQAGTGYVYQKILKE